MYESSYYIGQFSDLAWRPIGRIWTGASPTDEASGLCESELLLSKYWSAASGVDVLLKRRRRHVLRLEAFHGFLVSG